MSAQILSHRAPGIDDVLRVEAGLPAASVLESDRVGAGRDIIIAVDEDSLEAGDGLVAKTAIGRFLDQLVPSDRAAVVTIPRLPYRVGLTSNRVELFRAVERVSPGIVRTKGKYNIGLYEAFAIEQRDGVTTENVLNRECDPKRMTNAQALEACRVDVLTEGKQLANMGHDRGQRGVGRDAPVGRTRWPRSRGRRRWCSSAAASRRQSATPSSPTSPRPWQPAR